MDSFSVLPDEVLVHILSFLDTKGSVSTSILAKRWRFLWARVCHLSFVSDDFRPGMRARLSSIINRALLLHQGYRIEKFSLSYKENDGISSSELKTWVTTLIACNVRELILLLTCDVKLPRCLFLNKTLVKLELTAFCGDVPAVGLYLPALKILTILGVRYECDESLPHLLSGCPVLEELTTWTGFKYRCSISSPTIKKLVLGIGGDANDDDDEGVGRYIAIGTLPSLAEADISIRCRRMGMIGGDIHFFQYVAKIVGKVCDVKCLTFYTSAALMIQVPDHAFSGWTIKFHNLTKLYLASDWRFVTKFLKSADNLQDLTIRTGDSNFLLDWVEPNEVAACLVSRVEFVRFNWFGCGEEQEYKMIRYILRNAMVLKRMTVHMHRHLPNKELEAVQVQKIRSFKRGSEACEIAFEFD